MDKANLASRSLLLQIALTVTGATLGTLPAAFGFWQLESGLGVTLFLLILGVFVGVALSLPGVSAGRVFDATVEAIIDNNVPPAGKWVYETMTQPADDDTEAKPSAS